MPAYLKTTTTTTTSGESREGINTMDINETLRLFILNLPEIRALRVAAEAAPEPESKYLDAEAVERAIEDYDFTYIVENAVESLDLSDAVDNAISYGYVSITEHVDGSDLDIEGNSAITYLQERVDALDEVAGMADRITELEELVTNLNFRLDNASLDI